MKLIRYSKPRFNTDLWGELESLFDFTSPFFRQMNHAYEGESSNREIQPNLDLYEDEGSYFARLEVPGFSRKDIDVELHENTLTLKGSRKEKKDDREVEVSFARQVSLPSHIDRGHIAADYKSGLLTITLPKAEASRPRRIEVAEK